MMKEDRIKSEAIQAWVEIDELISRINNEKQAASRKLDELNLKLPKLLLAMTMGKAAREEVKALKAEMEELREVLRDAPIILQELDREKRNRCLKPLQDASCLSKERARYNGLKEKIQSRLEPCLIDELRRYARDIDEEDDCEKFLAAIGETASLSK